jgi:hypothetical protein
MKVCILALLAWLLLALGPLSTSAHGDYLLVCKNRRTGRRTARHRCWPSEVNTGRGFFCFSCAGGFDCADLAPGDQLCATNKRYDAIHLSRFLKVRTICKKRETAINFAPCSKLFSAACTTTDAACATNADCYGGSCFVPPGGCILFHSNCDPRLLNACPSGQFCEPIIKSEFPFAFPLGGVCGEGTGVPCLSTVDCPGGAICNPTTPP